MDRIDIPVSVKKRTTNPVISLGLLKARKEKQGKIY